mgnify:CR=1 FL=1
MKKTYIQPKAIVIEVELDIICQSIGVGGNVGGNEEGFERAAGKSRYSDWSDFEGR